MSARLIVLLLTVLFPAVNAWAAEGKTLSLNLCTDQLALAWLPPEQLGGVSFNAADASISLVAEKAKNTTLLRGTLEEIVHLAPAKVLLGEGQNPQLRRWLDEKGIPVSTLGMGGALAAVREEIRHMAVELDMPAQADVVIAAQESAFAQARFPREGMRVAVYYLRGFSDGHGTLLDEIIQRLGGVNLAAEQGGKGMQRLALEALVAGKPDIILLPHYGYGENAGGELTQHPALAASGAELVYLPGSYFTCPHLAITPLVTALGKAAMDRARAERYKQGHE